MSASAASGWCSPGDIPATKWAIDSPRRFAHQQKVAFGAQKQENTDNLKLSMRYSEGFEFVNRTEELETLCKRVFPLATKGTCTFLRSPSGFGKSRLTDRLIEGFKTNGPTCIVVDPAVRSRSRSDRIYAWFFVQRAAEPAARRTIPNRPEFCTFTEFLRKTQWLKINWKQVYENLKGVSSFRGLIKVSIEFAENLFKFGRYKPDSLLQEDSRYASEVAQAYIRHLVEYRPTLLVVRDSQNIDPESLAFFLTLSDQIKTCSLIFEYTNPHNAFSIEHEKMIFERIAEKESLAVLDLLRLSLKEFRYLLRKYAKLDQKIESIAELQWDGNLRIIRELKYRIMLQGGGAQVISFDLKSAIQENVVTFSPRRRLILAIITIHVEAINQAILVSTLQRIDPSTTESAILLDLTDLERVERYIRINNQNIALTDEDLSDALAKLPSLLPMLKLAATTLREVYLEIVNENAFTTVNLQSALRHAVALCASTGDIFALRNLVKILDRATRQAHNQSLYVNIVADIVLSRDELSAIEKRELIRWAASAAYETGDFATTSRLIQALPELHPFDTALLACCFCELNCHEDALQLVANLSASPQNPNVDLAGKLIECLALFAMRKTNEAVAAHTALRKNENYKSLPMFGFVLRFTEMVSDFPESTSDIMESVEVFERAGLKRSAAYSQLAGAMHYACQGQIKTARRLVDSAARELGPHIRDQQIILNNSAVIDLLSRKPDFKLCLEKLNSGLFTVGDDFTRLTLHNNRLICFAMLRDREHADHCIAVMDKILAAPGFGNRDIFITVCYNIWRYYTDAKQSVQARRYRDIAMSIDLESSCYSSYWKARFDLEKTAEPKFDFLMSHRYHPDYLSHWLIDLEGLNGLNEEYLQ